MKPDAAAAAGAGADDGALAPKVNDGAGAAAPAPATSCTLANGLELAAGAAPPPPPSGAAAAFAGRFTLRILRPASVASSAFCQVPSDSWDSPSASTTDSQLSLLSSEPGPRFAMAKFQRQRQFGETTPRGR